MRLRALGRSEVQPKVGDGFSGVRAHQTSVVEALGSAVQGSRGVQQWVRGRRRVFWSRRVPNEGGWEE